jgi:dethiobiotin synthetase
VTDILVTGTDTGVGKTVIAAGLLLALRDRGVPAIGFKPVESGVVPGEPADSDVLAQAGVEDPAAQPLLRLGEPLAPAVAAERAGQSLDPESVVGRIGKLRSSGLRVVVEGAGGLLAPLCWTPAGSWTALDLAQRCGLHAVVVARAGLGTLNHVLLTVEALDRARVPLRGVVLNGRGDPPDLAEATNPGALARLLGPSVPILVMPRVNPRDPPAVSRQLADLLASLL